MVGIVLFGLIGYEALPVSDLPTVDYPTINVNASLPGANPETMAASVATAGATILRHRRIDSINSSNSQGSTSITLQSPERNIDAARAGRADGDSLPRCRNCVRDAVTPGLRKVNPSRQPDSCHVA